MHCPKCHIANPEGANFCNECGHTLTLEATSHPQVLSFDEKLEKIQRYLPKDLTGKILSQKDKIEGERRQVTIMFCDMTGFTPLTEKLGPEETFSLINQVVEILIHKVHHFEGTVNELRGDGILALFGAPIALEEAPQRALRSALAIHREMERFNEKIRRDINIPPIFLRIGINTGPVVVGSVGNDLRVQFTAVGDTMNMASRMEGLAEPGTTYVTEETFRLTNGLFLFEPLGKKMVKGKKQGVPVYKLLSVKEDVYRPRLGSERMIYSEMVGRDRELAKLELQVMKAINGEGSIVNIVGEAGIGKSRLVAELKRREVMKKVTFIEGRAISIGRNLSFHPIIDILKQWARIRGGDGEAAALGKLETAVKRLYPENAVEVLPFVATLMGMSLSGRYAERIKGIEGEGLEKLILKNVRELLTKVTDMTPLVMVAEDLQWADTSSIGLLESLFRLAETQRILFINVFRPGHKETGDRIGETVKERLPRNYYEIMLEPLDERMSEALITSMLHISGLHYAAIGQIVNRAGGNPFFIEEVVRSFIDEGAVVLKEGAFEATEKIRTMAVPYTISDVLMSRIDRLEEETRQLLKFASVIGRNFFHRILMDVVQPMEDVEGRLSYLKEVQLVRERTRMGEKEYLFKHALAQEAAYASILPLKRKEMHLKVAESIERVFKERLQEFYGMLAYHYSNAEHMDNAKEYLVKAGEEALKSSASSEALNYYQEALSLYLKKYGNAGDPDKLAMLEKNIGFALFNKGHYADALEHIEKALGLLGIRSSKNQLIVSLRMMTDLLSLIKKLYFPWKRPTQIPDERDSEIFSLLEKKLISLAYLNPKRYFIEFLRALRWVKDLDITKIENGVSRYSGASVLFSWTGSSFTLSKKILEHVKGLINEKDIKEVLILNFYELFHDFLSGNWLNRKEYDENFSDLNFKTGQIWQGSSHIFFHCYIKIEQGLFKEADDLIRRLSGIWDDYENEMAREHLYTLQIKHLLKTRKLHDAQMMADESILFAKQTMRELSMLYYLGNKEHTNFTQ